MADLDITSILKAAGALTGSGGLVLGILYGLAALVKAWRDPSRQLVQTEATVLQKQLSDVQLELAGLKAQLEEVRKEVEHYRDQKYDMRYQRDKARAKLYALELKHGEPLTEWPPDPEEQS